MHLCPDLASSICIDPFGHRTAGGNGWVEGRHMLTISEEEIKRDATGILEAKLKKWLAGADGK